MISLRPLFSRFILLLVLCGLGSNVLAQSEDQLTVKDLAYGVSLYHLYQDRHLDAITELEVGEVRNTLSRQGEDAELLKGGLYFSYGLSDDARAIFNRLLEGKTNAETRNRVWFNLARIEHEHGDDDLVRDMLARIDAPLPNGFEDQKLYLQSNLFIKDKLFGEAARTSEQISERSVWKAYTQFNLGVALKQNWEASKEWLSKIANIALFVPEDEEIQAIADRARLAMGLYSMDKRDYSNAIAYISGVRSYGPLSNRALLASGWGWSRLNSPDKAIGHWQALRDKNQGDEASLEVLLAIPHGYEQKANLELAAVFFDQAAVRYDQVLVSMQQAIDSIQQGELIEALRYNRLSAKDTPGGKPFKLPRTPAATYLHRAMARKDFQTALRRYHELLEIQETLQQWRNDLPALDLMLSERRAAFESKRPEVEQFAGFAQVQELQKKRDALAAEVGRIERNDDYLALANEDERDYLQQLDDVEDTLQRLQSQRDLGEESNKYRLISGLLKWRLDTEFPVRLWRLKRDLIELDRALEQARLSAQSLQQAAARNDDSLGEYQQRISSQTRETDALAQRVADLIVQQEANLNALAVQAMQRRIDHLKELRLNARFSLVRLYDELLVRQAAK